LADWIQKNPALHSTDTARQHLAAAWTRTEPERALTLAGGIRQPPLRQEVISRILADWQESNATAADAFLRRYPQMAHRLDSH
jgi:hypothetical protein